MDRDAILAAMAAGQVLYVLRDQVRAYLIEDLRPRRDVPYSVALGLVDGGLVEPWGPHSWRLAPAPV